MKLRLFFIPGFALLQPGCSFFGVESVDCLPGEVCSASVGDGDGDTVGDGDGDLGPSGDGDLSASGGGDGDVATGGGGDGDGDTSGGGEHMGGAYSGGRGGTGGLSSGGSGGAPTGGSGGAPDGGSGGAPDGGSGGMPTGGSGGMPTGGTAQIAREIQINEVYQHFVEIYFIGEKETSLNLDDFRIVVDGNSGQACQLTDGVVDETNRYFVIQRTAPPCLGVSDCVDSCIFPAITNEMTVSLQVLLDGIYREVHSTNPFPSPTGSGESYQAVPDGSGDFTKKQPPTPGATNE